MNAPVFPREIQCLGKERFAKPTLAHRVLKRCIRQGKSGEVYHCVHCGGWHIGRSITRRPA